VPGEAGAPQTDGKGEISLRDIKFNYPTKKDVAVLKGVSIDIQKNKVIALVGPSGTYFIINVNRLWKIKHHLND